MQSSAFSHRISDAKRKGDHSQMVATRKHKHESPSPKYKNIWNICSIAHRQLKNTIPE